MSIEEEITQQIISAINTGTLEKGIIKLNGLTISMVYYDRYELNTQSEIIVTGNNINERTTNESVITAFNNRMAGRALIDRQDVLRRLKLAINPPLRTGE